MSIVERATRIVIVLSASLELAGCTTVDHIPREIEEEVLRKRANELLEEARPDIVEWREARIADVAYPLYRPDIEDVAYYEFPVVSGQEAVPAGFIVLSTGPHDYRVVQWSTTGPSNVQEMMEEADESGRKTRRYFMLDTLSFIAADESEAAIATIGDPGPHKDQAEGRAFRANYGKSHAPMLEALRERATTDWQRKRIFGNWCGRWKYYWAGSDADQRYYDQIPPMEAPNTTRCYSGCGATAWAMLFGWADFRAAQGDPVWGSSWGMYGGSRVAAPRIRDSGVSSMIWEIRNHIETHCDGNAGETWGWDMVNARRYLSRRSNSSDGTLYLGKLTHRRPFHRDIVRDLRTHEWLDRLS